MPQNTAPEANYTSATNLVENQTQQSPINLPSKQPIGNGSKYEYKKFSFAEYWATTMALFWKNITRLRRNIPVLLFQFALPAIQVILFCICIGADPFNIPLAVVNEDEGIVYSRDFLKQLDSYVVDQHNFTSVEEGKEAVRNGSMWGVLHIPSRFSQALLARMLRGEEVDNKTIEDSTIRVYPDLTSMFNCYFRTL